MTATSRKSEPATVEDRGCGLEIRAAERRPGTDRGGNPFPEAVIQAVWEKGHLIQGRNPDEWRCDICGTTIRRADHGNLKSRYGWEIDHVLPVAKGGRDDPANLRPLQWEINRLKGDAYPW